MAILIRTSLFASRLPYFYRAALTQEPGRSMSQPREATGGSALPLGALALLLASGPELLPFVQSPGGALGVGSPLRPAAWEPAGALRKQQSQVAMAAVSPSVPPGSSAPARLCSELGAGFSQLGAAPLTILGSGAGDGCSWSDGLQPVGPE